MKVKKNKKQIKRSYLIVTALVLLTIVGIFIFSNIYNNTKIPGSKGLGVTVSDWSGWSKAKPSEKNYNFDVKEGDSVKLKGLRDVTYNFKISNITNAGMTIQLPKGISESEGGGINLSGKDSLLKIAPGKEKEVCTQTTDAGTCFYFLYKK